MLTRNNALTLAVASSVTMAGYLGYRIYKRVLRNRKMEIVTKLTVMYDVQHIVNGTSQIIPRDLIFKHCKSLLVCNDSNNNIPNFKHKLEVIIPPSNFTLDEYKSAIDYLDKSLIIDDFVCGEYYFALTWNKDVETTALLIPNYYILQLHKYVHRKN